jgi:LuxR family maltose regulon positive regulatory protein
MPETLLSTKFFIPTGRPQLVSRPRLNEKLNGGLQRKLTLISAPAGFGKTTLVADWLKNLEGEGDGEKQSKVLSAWLALDESDNDPTRFYSYFISSLTHFKVIGDVVGNDLLSMLQSPQMSSIEGVLTELINALSRISQKIIFVLDDYHLIDLQSVHDTLGFLLENSPQQFHLAIATREDPQISLGRLRAGGQLTELRAIDLRFTSDEAADFLNEAMGLELTSGDVAKLESRTEGWIAGLQLAAISLQGRENPTELINSFTGSHRFVVDYLIEEVLDQQLEDVQQFLLQTSILDQLNGSLCDAVTGEVNSQQILENLEWSNLFIIPLDNDRHWYRYHHLFADLLGTRLQRQETTGIREVSVEELHIRASKWYEENGMEVEAFHHAALANDFDRAERLIEGNGLPISFRGIAAPVLSWLDSLPVPILNSHPSFWVSYAMTLLTIGQVDQAEEKLLAAENALEDAEDNGFTRDLFGRIATIRANIAVGPRQAETILEQLKIAFNNLDPQNLTYRTAAIWNLGIAHEFQGNREAAREAYSEAITKSKIAGNVYIQVLASTGLANIQLAQNQLREAEKTFKRVLNLVGDLPIPVGVHVHHCLGQIYYEWNEQDLAKKHANECLILAKPFKDQNDTYYECRLLLAKIHFAEGDLESAKRLLDEVGQSFSTTQFPNLFYALVETRVRWLLKGGHIEEAFDLAEEHDNSRSKSRVFIAQGKYSNALEILDAENKKAEEMDLRDEVLASLILRAITHSAMSDQDKALSLLEEGIRMAKPGGFIRIFVDEGSQMAKLLYSLISEDKNTEYIQKVLAAFPVEQSSKKLSEVEGEWIEPLSEREIEVLQLIAEGMTNQEVGSKLFLSLNTVKVHTRNIYSKLHVNNRTQAVSKAKGLGLLD